LGWGNSWQPNWSQIVAVGHCGWPRALPYFGCTEIWPKNGKQYLKWKTIDIITDFPKFTICGNKELVSDAG
jgi:hypothetical protein